MQQILESCMFQDQICPGNIWSGEMTVCIKARLWTHMASTRDDTFGRRKALLRFVSMVSLQTEGWGVCLKYLSLVEKSDLSSYDYNSSKHNNHIIYTFHPLLS